MYRERQRAVEFQVSQASGPQEGTCRLKADPGSLVISCRGWHRRPEGLHSTRCQKKIPMMDLIPCKMTYSDEISHWKAVS